MPKLSEANDLAAPSGERPARKTASRRRPRLRAPRRKPRPVVDSLADATGWRFDTARPGLDAGTVLQTQDGMLRYRLNAEDGGVLVERTSLRVPRMRLTQTFYFKDGASFERWCRSDRLRVEDPHVWAQLLRHGHELFAASH